MTPCEVEGEAAWIYSLAEADPLSPPAAVTLARRAMRVDKPVRRVEAALLRGIDACLIVLRGEPQICVRRGLPRQRERFLICHELAEWRLKALEYSEQDREDVANAIAAALVAPRAAFARAVRARGEAALVELASDFEASQTCAALRVGEVTGTPIAVLAPRSVRVRGDEWAWPDESTLRRLAIAAELPAPLRRVPILDDSRRTALIAA